MNKDVIAINAIPRTPRNPEETLRSELINLYCLSEGLSDANEIYSILDRINFVEGKASRDVLSAIKTLIGNTQSTMMMCTPTPSPYFYGFTAQSPLIGVNPYSNCSNGKSYKNFKDTGAELRKLINKLAEINGISMPSPPLHIINRNDSSKIYFIARYIKESLCAHADDLAYTEEKFIGMNRNTVDEIITKVLHLHKTTPAEELFVDEIVKIGKQIDLHPVLPDTKIPSIEISEVQHLEKIIDLIIANETNKKLIETVDGILNVLSYTEYDYVTILDMI